MTDRQILNLIEIYCVETDEPDETLIYKIVHHHLSKECRVNHLKWGMEMEKLRDIFSKLESDYKRSLR